MNQLQVGDSITFNWSDGGSEAKTITTANTSACGGANYINTDTNFSLEPSSGGVTITSPRWGSGAATDGQVLTWVGANGRWEPADATGGGSSTLAGLTDVTTTDIADTSIYQFGTLPAYTGGRVVVNPNANSAYAYAGLSAFDNGNIALVGGSSSTTRTTVFLSSTEEVFFQADPGVDGSIATDWTLKIEADGTDGQAAIYRTEPTIGTGTNDLVIPSMGQVRAYVDASGGGGAVFPLPAVTGSFINSDSTAATSQVLAAPPHNTGDLLVACIVTRDSGGTLTPPSGFTLFGEYLTSLSLSGDVQSINVFTKEATASEPATYTWTQASSGRICGLIVAVEAGAVITSITEGYGNATTATIATAANRLNITAATWMYAATSVGETYSQTGPGLVEITDSPVAQARISGGYTTQEGVVTSTHDASSSDNSPNHGMINIALKLTPSIDSLSDVDTTTAAPTDGQVLTWVDANSKWEPADAAGGGGGAVDSVNGQTGVVSLDLEDLGNVLDLAAVVYQFTGTNTATYPTQAGGEFYAAGSSSNAWFDDVDANGADFATTALTKVIGDPIWISTNGVSFTEHTLAAEDVVVSFGANKVRLDTTIGWPNSYNGGSLNDVYIAWSDPGVTDPTDGQVLTWVDANNQWEPADAAGGGAVASVNGETGVVSLGIQDLNDVVVPFSNTTIFEYSTVSCDSSSGAFNAPGRGRFGDGNISLYYLDDTSQDTKAAAEVAIAANGGNTGVPVWISPDGTTWYQYSVTISTASTSVTLQSVGYTHCDGGTEYVAFEDPTNPVLDIPDGQVLTWVDASKQWEPADAAGGGGTTTLDGLSDVYTPSPSNNEVLKWDGTQWVSATFGGKGDYVETSGDLTQFPLHGIDGFYADQAALEADGFTFITNSANADDAARSFSPGASWDGISFLGQSPGSANWFMNSNGGVGFDASGNSTVARNGDSLSATANIDFYVSWWNQDTATRLAGYKEVTIDGTDWLIVRADMKIPYNNASNGFPVEAWFSKKGEISVRYGTSVGGATFTVSSTANVICGSGSVYAGTSAPFTNLTSSGAYGISYDLPVGIPIDLDDLSDVDTTTTAPTDGQVLTWVDANGQWEPAYAAGGGGRSAVAVTTSSLASGASEDVTLAGTGKAGQFMSVTTDRPAWVVFYTDEASRAADAPRTETTSPSPGSGVLMEVITTAAETVVISPVVNYFNNESSPVASLPLKVTNKDATTQTVQVDVKLLSTEA